LSLGVQPPVFRNSSQVFLHKPTWILVL